MAGHFRVDSKDACSACYCVFMFSILYTYKLVVAQDIINAVACHDDVLVVAGALEKVHVGQAADRLLELLLVLGTFVLKVPKGPRDREIPFSVVSNNELAHFL
jgi:hypothetical protein